MELPADFLSLGRGSVTTRGREGNERSKEKEKHKEEGAKKKTKKGSGGKEVEAHGLVVAGGRHILGDTNQKVKDSLSRRLVGKSHPHGRRQGCIPLSISSVFPFIFFFSFCLFCCFLRQIANST